VTAMPNAQAGQKYLDMQALAGVTKHTGGYDATNELLSLCHIEDADDVLSVGCGIGVGPAYIARKHGCRVVGVDISEKMIDWSRRRAREERVEDKTEFHVADVTNLPFETNRFDVVYTESVLIFVEDKARAISECVRVTRPGGYVGLNEAFWTKQPPPELAAQAKAAVGPCMETWETWHTLWEACGLQDRAIRHHEMDARAEMKGRIQWISWRWLLRAWGRLLPLYVTNRAVRQSVKDVFDAPLGIFDYAAYGLFVGRKA
jgi:arsenite methyltransferase